MSSLRLEILSPEKKLLGLDVQSVTVPAATGWMGVLPGHGRSVVSLLPGKVRYIGADNKPGSVAVQESIAEIAPDKVLILSLSLSAQQK